MRDYQAQLIKINNIAGIFYQSKKHSSTLVIYGLGAPLVPDNGVLPDARIIMNFAVDLFVPDYLGFGKSDGIFTPRNCIKTFLNLYTWFTVGCIGINNIKNIRTELHYKRIIFIGRSLGGSYIPILPRFNKNIKELGLIYPAVDNPSCGSIKGEETNEDFLRVMRLDYGHLYRGIFSPRWEKHLQGEDDLSPMDNIEYLQNVKMFIGHGKKDQCIHYSKSVNYYKKILQKFSGKDEQFMLKLYPNSGHNFETSNMAVNDFLQWLEIKKYK